MEHEIPQWVLDVVFWTQNKYLAKIFEKAGKNSEKALEILKEDHRAKALELLSEVDKRKTYE